LAWHLILQALRPLKYGGPQRPQDPPALNSGFSRSHPFFSARTAERTSMVRPGELFGSEVFLMEVKSEVIYRARENVEKEEKKTRSSPKKK
jgi:hypothetical protein